MDLAQNSTPVDDAPSQEVDNNTPSNDGNVKTPQWYEKELAKVRDEAAKYRTRLRDAEAKLSAAKTQEDIDAAIKEFKEKNAQLERELLIARIAKGDPQKGIPALPDALAALLKGETEEELRKHAEELRQFVQPAAPPPPVSLQGGLDPSNNNDDFDPEAFANEWRAGLIPRASISGRTQ